MREVGVKKCMIHVLGAVLVLALSAGCSRGNLINPKNLAAPQILQLVPDYAQFTGGTKVAVIGSNLVKGAQIMLGDLPCTKVEYISEQTVICTTPQYPRPARVDVGLTNPNRKSVVLKEAFVFTDEVPPIAGATLTGGSVNAASESFRSSHHITYMGTGDPSNPIQSSRSFKNVTGPNARKFQPLY
jgi:hypothetical protein